MSGGGRRILVQPVEGYWFTSFIVDELRGRDGCFKTTLDIGLSTTVVCVSGNKVVLDGITTGLQELEPSEPDRVVLLEKTGRVYEVIAHSEAGFYKLKAIGRGVAPTLEINGIHMHRIKGVDPWLDSLMKVKAARVRSGVRVLDTCMGLGYTAIISLMRGASSVHSFEVDGNVVWIAERNPWSRRLSDERIIVHLEDVTTGIQGFDAESFDRIIHDPPRFTRSTGELYGAEFYRELYRVLKPGGILFHYTGEPRRHSAPDILKGVKNRLLNAGFTHVFYEPSAQGFVCLKKP